MTSPIRVVFDSHGSQVVGHLYLPASDSTPLPYPGLVLCHGFCGVKELLVPAFAHRFAAQGYAALTFDYRGFGESEGETGRLVPNLQIQDIKSAMDYLSSRDDIDVRRLALWGTSFGGANAVVVAAQDKRVKCLCVQLTFADGERVIIGEMSEEEKTKLLQTIEKMKDKKAKTGKEMMVPISKVLSDAQSRQFYADYKDECPALGIKIPFLTVAETMAHKPENFIEKVTAPILIIAAEEDSVNPTVESQRLYDLANEPKSLRIIPNASHYAVYEGELLEQTTKMQLDWLRTYLQ